MVKATAKKSDAYAGLADVLSAGFSTGLSRDDTEFVVALDDIEIVDQVRSEFETDEDSLADLGRSLQGRQLQAIGVRIMDSGSKPYRLIWGERRVRAARLVGITELLAKGYRVSDEEAVDLQLAENLHRKNLTQMEEARALQRDLDALGSTAAVLAKYKKSEAWLSKRLALLRLPEQAKRLVAESLSADLEVINQVATIERANPAAAKAVVETLKTQRGKVDARDVVAKVRKDVKPAKAKPGAGKGGSVATAKDRSAELPSKGNVSVSDPAAAAARRGQAEADDAYVAIFENGKAPSAVVGKLSQSASADLSAWLQMHFEAGKQSKDTGRAVMQGLRSGAFATDGAGALGLVAFLHGADRGAKFVLLNILGAIKA